MSLHTWIEIEFENGVYIVRHPEGSISFYEKDKLDLLKWIDKFLIGRRKLRILDTPACFSDDKCSAMHGGRSWED